ncbi:hydrolase, TatD family [Halobacteriovorax sp. BALOs_7]|uniref:TatD family hydrolase n=1 Tax=unclassified Halobacteriovorax TaxID=2639665 RepID=UPI000EA06E5B|nr:TatD family hydrolase [Halobacteriovorax sp. BALOs_7]AYF44770.1 hydrolase, TatD family [Halobacteriovorax sp. BALOs_7]
MTSKESQSAKFIDLHGHQSSSKSEDRDFLYIYSYSPKINDLPKEGQFFSAGVHPWEIEDARTSFEEIKRLCGESNCLMVGEAGLDRSIVDDSDLGQQEEVFKWHIQLANELKKPLIIHNVKCLSEIFRLHKQYPNHSNWVLHDFNGSLSDIQECQRRGIAMSLGPRFYESQTARIAHTISDHKIDLNLIFFETDERGDINIQTIYEKFAQKQEIEIDDLKDRIWQNLKALLGTNLTS